MSELTDEIDADAVDSGALTGAGFTPPGDCGNPNDHGDPKKGTDDPLYLWDVVKKLPSTNGYAVLGGQHMKLKDDFHKLLVASDRITGMECYNQNQFHIHLSGVKTAVRTQLNDAAKAGKIHDVTAWNDTLVTLGTPKDT